MRLPEGARRTGEYEIALHLHSDVDVSVKLEIVARLTRSGFPIGRDERPATLVGGGPFLFCEREKIHRGPGSGGLRKISGLTGSFDGSCQRLAAKCIFRRPRGGGTITHCVDEGHARPP